MPKDVFVSHSSKDAQIAATICRALEERGVECWIAPRDIGGGENFQESIVRAIRAAKIMVLVFSGNTNNSAEVKKELVLASQHQLAVIPLRTEAVVPGEAFAYELSTRQWVDLFHNWEVEIGRVGEQIRTMLAGKPVPEPAVPPPPAPPRTESKSAGKPKAGLVVAAAAVLLLVAAGGFYLVTRSPPPAPAASPAATSVAAAPTPAPVAPPTPAAAAPTDAMFWEAIRNGTSIGSYEAYLKQYPEGQFAALARLKIDELNAQAAALPVATALTACPDARAAAGGGTAISNDDALRLKTAQALLECGMAKLLGRDFGVASNEVGVGREIAEGLENSSPNNREYKAVLALAHLRTGFILRAQGDKTSAAREFQSAVKFRSDVVALAPRGALALIFLAVAEANLGQVQWETGQRDDARQSYGQCAAHRRDAFALRPNNGEWRQLQKDCEDAIAAIASGAPPGPPPSDKRQ